MSVPADIRALAQSLTPRGGRPLQLMQGLIVSVEGQSTCSLVLQGGEIAVGGWRWLGEAYAPVINDVVWVVDGGPGQRFILGLTNSLNTRLRVHAPTHFELNAKMYPNSVSNWPHQLLSPSTSLLDPYQQSGGGATLGYLRYYVPMHAGVYQATGLAGRGPNVGHWNFTVDGVAPGVAYDGYAAGYSTLVTYWADLFTIPYDKYVEIDIRKLGVKNAASTEYFVLWMSLGFGRVGLPPI